MTPGIKGRTLVTTKETKKSTKATQLPTSQRPLGSYCCCHMENNFYWTCYARHTVVMEKCGAKIYVRLSDEQELGGATKWAYYLTKLMHKWLITRSCLSQADGFVACQPKSNHSTPNKLLSAWEILTIIIIIHVSSILKTGSKQDTHTYTSISYLICAVLDKMKNQKEYNSLSSYLLSGLTVDQKIMF